jgi:hypothetical protein
VIILATERVHMMLDGKERELRAGNLVRLNGGARFCCICRDVFVPGQRVWCHERDRVCARCVRLAQLKGGKRA